MPLPRSSVNRRAVNSWPPSATVCQSSSVICCRLTTLKSKPSTVDTRRSVSFFCPVSREKNPTLRVLAM